MKKITRSLLIAAFLVVGFFTVMAPWSHAAVVRVVIGDTCPIALKRQTKADVAQHYGHMRAKPLFLCLDKPVLGLTVSHGKTAFAPFFRSIVILGPKGGNRDVAAHETMHAELAARSGVLTRTFKIPTWFDEGLAMQVDHRKNYSLGKLKQFLHDSQLIPPSLAKLSKPSGFYKAGLQGRLHYAFSRCVVGQWLEEKYRNTGNRLTDFTGTIGWLSRFPQEAFAEGARRCLNGNIDVN